MFPKSHFIALDFDGVIADSISECLVIGYNAFRNFAKEGHVIRDLSALSTEEIAEFKRLRNFIRSGEDYVFIRLAMANNRTITNQEEFDQFLLQNHHLSESFFQLFYKERIRLSGKETRQWIALNPLYSGMKDFLVGVLNSDQLAIISTKKAEFIRRILEGHKIDIPGKDIYHAGHNRSKLDIIRELMENMGIEPSCFHFIDDQVDTLIKIKPSGINLYLAGWGYNDEEQRVRAETNDISVLSLEKFYKQLGTIP